MKRTTSATTILAIIFSFGITSSAAAGGSGLAGKIFAVKAQVVHSLNPDFPVGLTFDNCYFFNEDGSWFDPLYPELGSAVPGIWIQHDDRPWITYTATVADPSLVPGLLLIQNGRVTSRSRKQKLLAYTSVIVDGTLLVVEVVSKGRVVDSCPFF